MKNTNYTFINDMPVVCKEQIYETSKHFINCFADVVTLPGQNYLRLFDIEQNLLPMQLNTVYNIYLKSEFVYKKDMISDNELSKYMLGNQDNNTYSKCRLKINGCLIKQNYNELIFCILAPNSYTNTAKQVSMLE